ncbi:alpha/beta hydrolase [Candidatus Albibeggiatoa sp. nov. NOAA]|uniref:alpha/beta hydrolase n=1 Tax=Candidatus Albibeggiatoa sp. nov. NOAA TaxID=3162724 RepID=UPI0032FAB21A|nr:alpha/beta hydrolase [Thiotrichaceae bacterium]
MPKLEILSHLPSQSSQKPPLLFVHGAFSGAWCWDEYFLPYFAKQGYPAYAVSLRGHGESEGKAQLSLTTLADFVSDVEQVTKEFDQPPILIGHSMGGMVVQKYIEAHPSTAAILMNTVPPSGLSMSMFYMAMSSPFLLIQLGLIQGASPAFASPEMIKQALFSNDDVSDDILQKFLSHWHGEAQLAVAEMLHWKLTPSKTPTVPMLVLGAGKDVFFPQSNTCLTAHHYHADWHTFQNLAHAMMLEKDWQSVADYILDWLKTKQF